jgi:streptogramin lyase
MRRFAVCAALSLPLCTCGDSRGGDGGEGADEGIDGSGESGDGESADGDAEGDGDGDGDGDGPKYDVGGEDTGEGCQGQCGNTEWSYIWIANSNEATLSKIDTRQITEEGRYRTRPDGSGNPSRTSVSIDAKAVAVANRMGGVTKIWAKEEFCEDKNQDNQITTSTGKNDVLPFDQEECIAWHTPFPLATTQRPVAWTSGVYNAETCEYEDQKIWTANANGTGGTWPCDGADGIYTYRLDGDTGEIEDTIHMPDVTCGGTFGPYGAAVDFDGNLWMYIWSAGTIVYVDFETLDYTTYPGGAYGITVDTEGRPWTGDYPRRFNLQTKQWESPNPNLPGAGGSGIAQDLQGRMWTATQGGVGWVDMETLQLGDTVPLPEGAGIYRGISVDVDGYVWAVLLGGTTAHRIDPDTYDVQTYNGLNYPYTYSDMSGGQLNNVTCNPPEG